jgi:NADPH:quinone reductase-like Zn-dependent oxidoreductase
MLRLKAPRCTEQAHNSGVVTLQDFLLRAFLINPNLCRYVLHVPDNLDFAATAPLLCAGITTYSPMRYYGMDKPGKTFGVVGLGGLGHMAVQFGKAFGMHVIVFSTSPSKKEEALKGLGADEFVVTKDEEAMKVSLGVPLKVPLQKWQVLLARVFACMCMIAACSERR